MSAVLKPIITESLKDIFVSKFEALILSGDFSSGEVLPSERELAQQLQVSRPVVHEGLLELAGKGLVTIKPRARAVVNDLRKEGSLALLLSLVNYHGSKFDPHIQKSILDLRLLFEVENARLAAIHIKQNQLNELEKYIRQEKLMMKQDNQPSTQEIVTLDFQVHHLLAEASGNFIYPLLMNSFKQVYYKLSAKFFSKKNMLRMVFSFHNELYIAIKNKNVENAKNIMTELLEHGASQLEKVLKRS